MAEITQAHLDAQTELILSAVKRGFEEQGVQVVNLQHDLHVFQTDATARFGRIEATLAKLTESVDRFAKIYTDLNQEVVVMRQQLRDVEARVGKLELKLKAA